MMSTPGTLKRDRSGRPLFDIVALAASAGGLQALIRVLEGLPGDFGAAVVISSISTRVITVSRRSIWRRTR